MQRMRISIPTRLSSHAFVPHGCDFFILITSPTFNIVKEYVGELPLNHMDVYRTNGKIDDLGIEEYFNNGGVTIIEWAEMIEQYLPEERLDIKIKSSGDDENRRTIILIPHGTKYEEVCEAVI